MMVTIWHYHGCPVGIGPEIILRSLSEDSFPPDLQPIIIGDLGLLKHLASELNLSRLHWLPGCLIWPCLSEKSPWLRFLTFSHQSLIWGKPNATTGIAMAQYIEKAVALTQQGILHGVATCPISKVLLNDAGYLFPGHTEMLAKLTQTDNFAMMMAGKKLKVTLVTIHRPLKEVAASPFH